MTDLRLIADLIHDLTHGHQDMGIVHGHINTGHDDEARNFLIDWLNDDSEPTLPANITHTLLTHLTHH